MRSGRSGPGLLGVVQRLLEQLADPLAVPFQVRVGLGFVAGEDGEAVEVDDPVEEVAEEDEEGVGVALLGGGERLEADDVLVEDLGGEGAAAGEVAVEGALADAGAARHLAHRDVGGIGEELAGGVEDRGAVVARVAAQPVWRSAYRHGAAG